MNKYVIAKSRFDGHIHIHRVHSEDEENILAFKVGRTEGLRTLILHTEATKYNLHRVSKSVIEDSRYTKIVEI